ncbi:MAG TPA: hypothetical protein VFH69_02195 [Gemmatimonadota bacterium]|nr:hypothetical protein [Gemmatimonadota bacterium]
MRSREQPSPAIRWRMAAALALWATLGAARPVDAQFGIDRLLGGGEKGKVYGLDVRDTPSLVFVVDFAIQVEAPGLGDQLQDAAVDQAADYAQQKAIEKGGEVALMAAGPAGTLVRAGLAKRRDRAGRAESHVRAAIKGLDDDQSFSIVYFDGGPQVWNDALIPAEDDAREGADELIDGLYEGEGLMSMATMGMVPSGTPGTTQPGAPATAEQLLAGIDKAIALGPETIVVIVAESPPNASALLDGVAALNADGRVVIHTAGFAEEQDAPSALRNLAEANGGTYLFDDTPDDEESEEESEEADD